MDSHAYEMAYAAAMAAPAFSMTEDANNSMGKRRRDQDDMFIRPLTSSGRPPTGSKRPSTAKSMKPNDISRPIVTLLETRAREIGFSIFYPDLSQKIELVQLEDNQSYSHTLSLLQLLQPSEIILPRSHSEKILTQRIIAFFEDELGSNETQVLAIHRKFFDDVQGQNFVKTLSCTSFQTLDDHTKHSSMASISALIKYLEQTQNFVFSNNSLYITWRNVEGRMSVDHETVRHLELLRSLRVDIVNITGGGNSKTSIQERHRDADNVFDSINFTNTPLGTRLLRSQLVAPPIDIDTINMRQDCVVELLSSETMFLQTSMALTKLLDLDVLIGQVTNIPKVATPRSARILLKAFMGLKHCLQLFPVLFEPLLTASNPLLQAIAANLQNEGLSQLLEDINRILTDEANWTKNTALMRQAECMSVQEGIDGNLDIMRSVYMSAVLETEKIAEQMREEWGIPTVKLAFSMARGYHLLLPPTISELPEGAIQGVKMKSNVACTTETLAGLNERIKEALTCIYMLSNAVILGLVERVRMNLHLLHRAAESIALLDMLVSFASVVTQSDNPDGWSRPTLVERGDTHIIGATHPLLCTSKEHKCVPNNFIIPAEGGVLIITGPNSSGKSTYIRTIAICVLLAHLGGFAPAQSAIIQITPKIASRLGTGDDMLANASTFYKEMKEAVVITRDIVPQSLILIDELGRGTSNEDGVGLAWAFAEEILQHQATCLFVTHYHELTALESLYTNASNVSMAMADPTLTLPNSLENTVSVGNVSGNEPRMAPFSYSVTKGASMHTSDYGIAIAAAVGMPRKVINDALAIKNFLKSSFNGGSIMKNSMTPGMENSEYRNPSENVLSNILCPDDVKDVRRDRACRQLIEQVGQALKLSQWNGELQISQFEQRLQQIRDDFGLMLLENDFTGENYEQECKYLEKLRSLSLLPSEQLSLGDTESPSEMTYTNEEQPFHYPPSAAGRLEEAWHEEITDRTNPPFDSGVLMGFTTDSTATSLTIRQTWRSVKTQREQQERFVHELDGDSGASLAFERQDLPEWHVAKERSQNTSGALISDRPLEDNPYSQEYVYELPVYSGANESMEVQNEHITSTGKTLLNSENRESGRDERETVELSQVGLVCNPSLVKEATQGAGRHDLQDNVDYPHYPSSMTEVEGHATVRYKSHPKPEMLYDTPVGDTLNNRVEDNGTICIVEKKLDATEGALKQCNDMGHGDARSSALPKLRLGPLFDEVSQPSKSKLHSDVKDASWMDALEGLF